MCGGLRRDDWHINTSFSLVTTDNRLVTVYVSSFSRTTDTDALSCDDVILGLNQRTSGTGLPPFDTHSRTNDTAFPCRADLIWCISGAIGFAENKYECFVWMIFVFVL